MDLADLKPVERAIEILHPGTDEPIGIRVNLVSMDDPRLKQLRRRFINESQKAAQKNKILDADDLERNSNEVLFAATTGWEWYGENINFHGEKPEYTKRNFYAVIDELPWFKRQISEVMDDTKGFFDASPTN